jgi:hypothetical protein
MHIGKILLLVEVTKRTPPVRAGQGCSRRPTIIKRGFLRQDVTNSSIVLFANSERVILSLTRLPPIFVALAGKVVVCLYSQSSA